MSPSPSLLTTLQVVRDRYRSCAREYSQLEVQLSGARLCERIAADLDAVLALAGASTEELKPQNEPRASRGTHEHHIRLERSGVRKKARRPQPTAIADADAKSYDPIADARSFAALRAEGGKQ